LLTVALGAAVAIAGLGVAPAKAEDPTFIPWPSLLPSFTTGYEPSSANDCTAGRIQCVDAVIREMGKRVKPLDDACSHNVMFGLMYWRTTEQYKVSATQPGFFTDPSFINHQDAVFARYYFDAWDGYYGGDVAGTPKAWQIAFSAGDQQRVSGLGNMMLGMSAHVNRDLPMVLAEIGLVKPDGTSRKPDHDKVNEFLNLVIQPLIAEAAARFDPTVDDVALNGTTMDETGIMQLLMGWREQAWRNAEAIVNAPTEAARQVVLDGIERMATVEGLLITVATAYSPLDVQSALTQLGSLLADPARVLQAQNDRTVNQLNGVLGTLFTNPATTRNRYCATHG
jgi:hypothetical protein